MEGLALTNRDHSRRHLSHCIRLHKAALKGRWEDAETIFSDHPHLLTAPITEGGLTALHVASMEPNFDFVSKLLDRINGPDLEIVNHKGNTALCFAAAAGNDSIVKLMLGRNPRLGGIHGGDDDSSPLYMAAFMGHHETFRLLYDNELDFDSLRLRDRVSILTACIDSGLYVLAMEIVDRHRDLAIAANDDNETPLEILARTPAIFSRHSSDIKRRFWVSPFRRMDAHKLESDAYKLFAQLWDHARRYQEDGIEAAPEMTLISPKLLFTAAESENDEFLVEIINRYPDFLYTMNSLRHSIFHIAVLHRNVQVFNLIYELNSIKDLTARYIDTDGNNMLHLAAKLAPQERLSAIPGGVALQMQQEVMWFKEVEKIVAPRYRTMENLMNQTPRELFILEHGKMMSEGEKMMKTMAKPFMLVTLLIPTLAFATAVTVPGGYSNSSSSSNNNNLSHQNKYGSPNFFEAFPISVAAALFSSVISMLMFLYIMTSRCNDKFFLVSPLFLVCGLFALFVSIGSMIVAFCTCPLFNQQGRSIAGPLLMLLVFVVPVMFMVLGPLLVSVLRSTFSSRLLFGSNNRLFS